MKYNYKKINLTEDTDGNAIEDSNFITFEGEVFFLKYLSLQYKSSKGGNSSVFILYDKNGYRDDRIIKICNYHKQKRNTPDHIRRRYGRFINEIKALEQLKEERVKNIVILDFNDVITLDGKEFPFYVMEKGDTDFKEYLLSNPAIDNQEKVKLCLDLFNALKELHQKDFYHRDIKPDNIFLFREGEDETKYLWKIGDLGLIAERQKDYDDLGEKVGPFGWISPEAMNKYLTERAMIGFDCKIDDKSDIFQLGKIFWFIFQLNVPIGQIKQEDFICTIENKDTIFGIIENMLQYSKHRRSDIARLESQLDQLKTAFVL